MNLTFVTDFPTIDNNYTDEFGSVNADVYGTARSLWCTSGKAFANEMLNDAARGSELMIRAAAIVTGILESDAAQIHNVRAYLYRCFKNLVFAEAEKETSRHRILGRYVGDTPLMSRDIDEDLLNRRILINELRREMNPWTRTVFDLHTVGYSFEELVPRFGSAANVIRSRYSKEVARLAQKINSRVPHFKH